MVKCKDQHYLYGHVVGHTYGQGYGHTCFYRLFTEVRCYVMGEVTAEQVVADLQEESTTVTYLLE